VGPQRKTAKIRTKNRKMRFRHVGGGGGGLGGGGKDEGEHAEMGGGGGGGGPSRVTIRSRGPKRFKTDGQTGDPQTYCGGEGGGSSKPKRQVEKRPRAQIVAKGRKLGWRGAIKLMG